MKAFVWLLTLVAAACVGGYTVVAHPNLPAQAQQAANDGAQFVQTEAGRLTRPSTAATAAPTTHAAVSLAAQSASTPAPVTGQAGSWSSADCTWAIGVLKQDAALDLAEAYRIQSGQDTRYGTGPAGVAYYRQWSGRWTTAHNEVAALCTSGTPISEVDRTDALSWFNEAIANHEADTSRFPGNADWNSQWIANYQRLSGLFAS